MLTLHEKPYFQIPGKSWEAQKVRVNIIFPSTLWIKKDRITHHQNIQNKKFAVITNFSQCFLAQKTAYFLFPKNSKQQPFSNQ